MAAAQLHGDAADRLEVLGDVFASESVAAGSALDEAPLLKDEGDGEAVDLGLADHLEVAGTGPGAGALVPGLELREVEGVGEGEERVAVFDDAEGLHRDVGHPLS